MKKPINIKTEACKNLSEEDLAIVLEGLHQEAFKAKKLEPIESFAFTTKDETNTLVAAVSGNLLYGAMYIDSLFVAKEYRGNGYGLDLMQHCEQLARDNGCSFIVLTTMDWEARGFYEKLGFVIEYKRHGYKRDSIMYVMRKDL